MILKLDIACFLPEMHILTQLVGVCAITVEVPLVLHQSSEVEFLLSFCSTPILSSCIEVLVALQGTQITPRLTHLVLAAH